MSPFDVWLLLVTLGVAVGFAASIKSTCLDMLVATNRAMCRKRYRWIEWGDVAPKSAISMSTFGVVDVAYWGVREIMAERGVSISFAEATVEYAMVWGGVLAAATGVLILTLYLPLRSLRE
jgi:hypothetical protein